MSKRATREAFGSTLVQLAEEGIDVVAVEADLSKSTTTATFADAYPERFFNAGIAEQNMINVAAGLAVAGKVAFTGSFAVFAAGRAYDQVRNTVCYSELDVKLAPTHSGITVGPDGGSHQMLEDLALMRVLPGMRVVAPADYHAACDAIRVAASTPGPFYIRLGRAAIPAVYDEGFRFELGKAYVLREGSDVTLAACGVMVERALAAAELLADQGVSAWRPSSPSMRTPSPRRRRGPGPWSRAKSIRSSEGWARRWPRCSASGSRCRSRAWACGTCSGHRAIPRS